MLLQLYLTFIYFFRKSWKWKDSKFFQVQFGHIVIFSTTKKASSTLLLLFGLEVWGSENSEDAKEICLEISSWTSTIILWTKEIGKYSCIFIIFSTALLRGGGSEGAMGPSFFFGIEKSTYISKKECPRTPTPYQIFEPSAVYDMSSKFGANSSGYQNSNSRILW